MQPLIGFLSDAHGNGPAFDRAINLLRENGAQRIYFLGDAIGYVPTTRVLDSLLNSDNTIRCIRGNHEDIMLKGSVDSTRDEVYQLEAVRAQLTPAQKALLETWPTSREITVSGQKLLLVHGSPSNPTYGYVYPDTDLTKQVAHADWVIMGNSHYPFIREYRGVQFINCGSCGMPRDDGRYGSVALIDMTRRHARILRFNIEAEIARILEEGPEVHSSVHKIFERRSSAMIGEICD